MAVSTRKAQFVVAPDIRERELSVITGALEQFIHKLRSKHAVVNKKLEELIEHAQKKKPNTENLSIKYVLVAILDAIYDSFAQEELPLIISDFEILLAELSQHHQHEGFSKSAKHGFILYFHKLLRKRETVPAGFFSWFESFTLAWQEKKLFGTKFDLHKWKVATASY